MLRRRSAALMPLGAAVLSMLLSGCGSSEPTRVAATIVIAPSPVSFASVGATQQLTAVVRDQMSDTMIGAAVTWSSGNAAAATVSATGLVTAVANGTAQVTASSGTASQSVTVTVAQVPSQLVSVSGDAQSGTVGQALAQPLVVQVNDANAHPIANVSVAFTAGAGSVPSATVATGSDGRAQSAWTLGTTAGSQSATATVAAISGTTITFTATAGPGAAASVAKQAGDNQAGNVSLAVTTAPAVVVKDAYNNVKPGAVVTFAVASGGGSVTGAVDTTDASGIASVGSWTLGAVSGTNTLTATVTGTGITGNPLTFTATGTPRASQLFPVAGINQTGLVGYALNVRPAVRTTDGVGNPVAGVPVTFAVASGGGSATQTTVNSDANGVAQVGSWVLGSAAGTNTLTATVPGAGVSGNPITFTATGEVGTYTITLRNVGPPLSAGAQAAFDAAAAKWQTIIYRDIPDFTNLTAAAGACNAWQPAVGPVNVDDVLILMTIDSIDGPGNVLGSAGPCYIRTSSRLTILGTMRFDSADVANLVASGQYATVVTHEMGHVLGFGTLWDQTAFNCLQNPSTIGAPVDTYFSCAKARAMFDSIGGTSYTGGNKVPVENCSPAAPSNCGDGTVNGHWREPVFTNELMTGWLNSGTGVVNPLSRLTAAAMEDIGYVVNYAGADSYTQTYSLRMAGPSTTTLFLGNDIGAGPIRVVDAAGRVVEVIQPARRR